MSPCAIPSRSRKRAMATKSVRAFSSARGLLKFLSSQIPRVSPSTQSIRTIGKTRWRTLIPACWKSKLTKHPIASERNFFEVASYFCWIAGNFAVKATHGAFSLRGGDRIGQGKPARHHQRQAEIVFRHRALLQVRIDEGLRRMLDGFLVIGDLGVRHDSPTTVRSAWCRRASCGPRRAPRARNGQTPAAFAACAAR